MADKLTETSTGYYAVNWTDDEGKEKITYFTMPNPRAGNTYGAVARFALPQTHSIPVIINSKNTSSIQQRYFQKSSDAYKETKRTIQYDIGIDN